MLGVIATDAVNVPYRKWPRASGNGHGGQVPTVDCVLHADCPVERIPGARGSAIIQRFFAVCRFDERNYAASGWRSGAAAANAGSARQVESMLVKVGYASSGMA